MTCTLAQFVVQLIIWNLLLRLLQFVLIYALLDGNDCENGE